jgi:enoyl-CoA hydratase
MSRLVTLERQGTVAILTLDNPPAGALGEQLVAELADSATAAAESGTHAVVLRSAVEGYFGAGADLKLLESVNVGGFMDYLDRVRDAIDRIAHLGCVTIAAIDGRALGGGLELALACTFRIAGPAARLGLPEVKLGLLPGAGGTQRLTRLAGRDVALDLMLSGRTIGAQEGRALGLVSRVAEHSAYDDALAWAADFDSASPDALAAIIRCVDGALPATERGGLALEATEIYSLFRGDAATRAISDFVAARRRAA